MKVWVTRDEEPGGPLCAALTAVGLDPVLEPVIGRSVVDDCAEVLSTLSADDWLILTSIYAIENIASEPARVAQVAVVGDKTREAAEARGFRVGLVSTGGDRASLLDDLRSRASSGKVCYPRSSEAPEPEGWPGVEMISPVMYETRPRGFDRGVIEGVDVVTVASPSAVLVIGRLDLPFASIGPTTSKALRAFGIEPWLEAPARTFESLATAIAEHAHPAA